jgi:hypothetical protein
VREQKRTERQTCGNPTTVAGVSLLSVAPSYTEGNLERAGSEDAELIIFRGNYRSSLDLQNNYRSTVVSIFKIITDLVSILHLFLRVHSTGTIFVIYFKIGTI